MVCGGPRRDKSDGLKLTFPDPAPQLAAVLVLQTINRQSQGGFDGRGQQTASPMLTAIMSGGVGISGRELYKYR